MEEALSAAGQLTNLRHCRRAVEWEASCQFRPNPSTWGLPPFLKYERTVFPIVPM